MRRLALVAAVALASGRADALGLGDIELHSALNEPLNAEVQLLSARPAELENAVVRLAPNAEFVRAGIERSDILSDLHFTIVPGKSGASVVKITSTKPIREPFLDFVVQLHWQAGQLLREYTVLLDPPVFGEEETAAPVTSPVTAAPSPAPKPETKPKSVATTPSAPMTASAPVPAKSAPAAAAEAPSSAPSSASVSGQARRNVASPMPAAGAMAKAATAGKHSYGPTKRNDTLWNIANTVRPDDSVSVYQMMLALLKDNPQAFYHDNINNLKAGYVLRVPDKTAIAAIDQQQAVQEAARQYEEWQKAKRGIAPTAEESAASQAASKQGKPSPIGGVAQSQEKESARLRLVAPGETVGGTAAGGVQTELDKLRGDLAMALESSDSAKRESDELRSRVATLEEQINSLQKLLSLKDQALSDMQKRSGLEVPPEAQTQVPAPAGEAPATKPAAPAPAKPAPAKPAQVKPKTTPAPAKESSGLFADRTFIGGVAAAVLLLFAVVWVIIRRRRSADAEDGGSGIDIAADEMEGPAINIQLADDEGGASSSMEEEITDPHMTQVAEEVAQDAEQHVPQAASDLDVLHTSEGEIDPIVEADVYLAYRRYQQAEALVRSALEKQPNRQDLLAKLLEIFYAAKNSEEFYKTAQSLFINLGSNTDDPLWQRILPMGRELCPDQDLFASQDEGHDDQQPVSAEESPTGVGSETAQQTAQGDVASEDSFDLNIGAADTGTTSQEEKMDFDLNLGGAVESAEQPQESKESLGDALDLGVPAAKDEVKESAPAGGDGSQQQEKTQNSWDIEPAMSDFGNIDFGLDDSDLLAGTDVVGTKLDLARAYIDMGDNDSARDILKEVVEEGNNQQKQEASALMENMA